MKIVVMALVFCIATTALANELKGSPLGKWETIDDITGKPRAIVELYQDKQQHLYGKILKVYATEEEKQHKTCEHCKGEKHNQPIVGMVFLDNLKKANKEKATWAGGKILDPKTGHEYKCQLRVVNQGEALDVRGYVGMPLFGRTQKWVRVTA